MSARCVCVASHLYIVLIYNGVICFQKELYSQEMEVFRERQRREVAALEREVGAARAQLAETSAAYEDHIRGLTSELWRLGERLVERGEDRPRAPSLLSLQQLTSV